MSDQFIPIQQQGANVSGTQPAAPIPPAQLPVGVPAIPVKQPENNNQYTPSNKSAVYVPNTGDVLIDSTVGSFSKAYGVSEELFQLTIAPAIESGDFSKLNQYELSKQAGPEAAAAAYQLYQAVQQRYTERTTVAVQTVYEAAGGEANWKGAVEYFNYTQPDFIKEHLGSMLDSGNKEQMQYAANQVVQLARQSGVIQGSSVVPVGAGFPGTSGSLSAAEFSLELQTLRKEAGNRSLESGPFADKYKQLMERRAAGHKQGK